MFALYQHKFDEKLKERCFNTYKFSNRDNNKFILLLWKGVYPYEYMDDWEKLNETSLPQKRRFLQSLKNGRCYWYRLRAHERVCKVFFEIKKFRRISWFVCSIRYIIVVRCIWKLSKYVSWNIWTWSCKISFSPRISIANSFKKD